MKKIKLSHRLLSLLALPVAFLAGVSLFSQPTSAADLPDYRLQI